MDSLGKFLSEAPAQELGRIRPLALAGSFEIDKDLVINSCLSAAKLGLLDIYWDILCPTCRISSMVAPTLQDIENHARCEVCDLDFEVDLVYSVELIFRANPEIRAADLGTYCIGGPEHSPHVLLQVRMAPGERVELDPVLSEGQYVLRSAQLTYKHELRVLPLKGTTRSEIVLSLDYDPRLTSQLRAGRNVLAVTNDYNREIVIRLERSIPLTGVVTAAQATALPAFREMFPEELLKSGALINVSTITLMGLDIADTDQMFDELGDAAAYNLVQRFHETIERCARENEGSVIKVAGTEILCTFDSPQNAIRVATKLTSQLNTEDDRNIQWRGGLHRGTALATSNAGAIDYFGNTVHLVQRLTRIAGAGELLMTETVANDPQVDTLIKDRHLSMEINDLPLPGLWGRRGRRIHIEATPQP